MTPEQDIQRAIEIVNRHIDHWFKWHDGSLCVWGDDKDSPRAVVNVLPVPGPKCHLEDETQHEHFMVAWLDDNTSDWFRLASDAYQAIVDRFILEPQANSN